MRRGTPIGVPSSCRLFLPFWKGRVTDWSGQSNTVTKVGTPKTVEGYYGSALSFDGASDRLSVADASAINFTGDFSVECWFRPEAQGEFPLLSRRDTTGGQDDAWELVGELDSSGLTLSVTVWDSGATSDTWTVLIPCRSFRWYHVRFGFDAGAAGYLFVDGDPVLTKTTTLANVDGAGLGPLLIGGELLAGTPAWFTGRIGGVRLRAATDSSAPTLSPRLVPTRISRRQIYATDLDVAAHVQDLTWTDDTNGGWYADLDDFPGGALIIYPEDVISVRLLDGSTTTTCTEVGNVVDLDAGGDFWFTDTVNRRLYLGQDPADYDRIEVVHRFGVAQATVRRGSRVYHGCVLSEEAGERRMAGFDEPYPQGSGGVLTLARNHPALPAGLWSESAGTVWTQRRVKTLLKSDGLHWSEAISIFRGFVDAQPDDTSDTAVLQTVHEGARLFRVPLTQSLLTRDEYPTLPEEFDGARLNESWGLGLKLVPAYQLTSTGSTWETWGFAPFNVARIAGVFSGLLGPIQIRNVDLDAGTFEHPAGLDKSLTVVVDGFGEASDPTSPTDSYVYSWGDPADAETGPLDMLAAMLTYYLGAAAPAIGATFAATAARIARERRFTGVFEDGAALARELQKHLGEIQALMYFPASTDTVECEDLVKADAIEYTLTDEDVIEEEMLVDDRLISKLATAEAWEYIRRADGSIKLGTGASLSVDGQFVYRANDVWRPQGGRLGVYSQSAALDVLTFAQPFLQRLYRHPKVLAGPRFQGAEQMDVVNVQTTRIGADAGRYRIKAIQPVAGKARMLLMPEAPWPTDGTSSAGVATAGPYRFARYSKRGGLAVADTAGAWTAVSTHLEVWHGSGLPSDLDHRFAARVSRTGGTDVELRIVTLNTSTLVVEDEIAKITTIGAAGFYNTTTFNNIPADDKLIQFQVRTTGGAAATVFALDWGAEEGATNGLADPVAIQLQASTGYAGGVVRTAFGGLYVDVDTTKILGQQLNPQGGGEYRVRVATQLDTANTVEFELGYYQGAGTFRPILRSGVIDADGIYEMTQLGGQTLSSVLTTLRAKPDSGQVVVLGWSGGFIYERGAL